MLSWARPASVPGTGDCPPVGSPPSLPSWAVLFQRDPRLIPLGEPVSLAKRPACGLHRGGASRAEDLWKTEPVSVSKAQGGGGSAKGCREQVTMVPKAHRGSGTGPEGKGSLDRCQESNAGGPHAGLFGVKKTTAGDPNGEQQAFQHVRSPPLPGPGPALRGRREISAHSRAGTVPSRLVSTWKDCTQCHRPREQQPAASWPSSGF